MEYRLVHVEDIIIDIILKWALRSLKTKSISWYSLNFIITEFHLFFHSFIKGFIHRLEPECNDNKHFIQYTKYNYLIKLREQLPRNVLDKKWPSAPQLLKKVKYAWSSWKAGIFFFSGSSKSLFLEKNRDFFLWVR